MTLGIGAGTATEFVSSEFSNLQIRDRRLISRACNIMHAMQKKLSSCVRRLYNDTKEVNSNYLLLIQDGMRLNYTKHLAKTELGRIGKAMNTEQYGLIQHSTLCVTQDNEALGLIDAQFFHYDELDTKEHHHHRNINDKVSKCWLTSLRHAKKRIGKSDKKLVVVADREGDFFEFLHELVKEKTHFVVRAKHNRCTGEKHRDRGEKMRDLLAKASPIGSVTRSIQDVKTRAVKNIKLSLKAISVTLPPPNKSKTEKKLLKFYQ